MAKKLIYNYEFTPGGANAGVIKFKGRHPQRTLLLVTNVTRSTIIYNFAGAGFGGTVTYDAANDESTLTLETDTSAQNSADELQIFLDIREDKVDFSETFTDPVSKLRVSNPQNLIDTDFEYGLQPTKWETVELVNNIPSFFAANDSYSIGDVVAVNTSGGSKAVTVITQEPHGLQVGSPFEIQGLSQKTAEGKYLVTAVESTTVFSYNAKKKQTATSDVSGSYTVVTPGQFYESADISTAGGINTNEASKSSLTVSTDYTHGFETGSSLYLTNTYGNEAYVVDSGSATAGDGRPFIDYDQTVTTTIDLDESKISTRHVNSTYFYEFQSSDVDVANNSITWNNHGLKAGDCVLYLTSPYDSAIGGLERQQIYYVKSATTNSITLCETTNGAFTTNSTINFSSAGTFAYGPHSFHLAYEIRYLNKNSYNYYHFARTRYQREGTGSGWDLASGMNNSRGLGGAVSPYYTIWIDKKTTSGSLSGWHGNGLDYATYNNADFDMGKTTTGVVNDSEFMEGFDRYTAYSNSYAPNYWSTSEIRWYNAGTSYYSFVQRYIDYGTLFVLFLRPNAEAETFFKENHGLETGDTVTYSVQSGQTIEYISRPNNNFYTNGTLQSVPSGTSGTVTKVDDNRFKIQLVTPPTGYGAVARLRHIRGQYQLTGTFNNDAANSIFVGSNNLNENQQLTVTSIGGFPTTATGILEPTINTITSVYDALKTWCDGQVASNGSSAGKLIYTGSSFSTPISNSRVQTGDYGYQQIYLTWYRYSYSRFYRNYNNYYIGQWNHGHGPFPPATNSGVPVDYHSNIGLLRDRGFYYLNTPWTYNTTGDYLIHVAQIPDATWWYNATSMQLNQQLYTYQYSNGTRYSYLTGNGSYSIWKTKAGGWRYSYKYTYTNPTAFDQGLVGISVCLENTNWAMQADDQNRIHYMGDTGSSNPLGDFDSYLSGQRYHIHMLIPQKKGTSTTLYATNQTDAETLVDQAVTSVTTALSYPVFTSPSTTAYANKIDDNRIRLLGSPDGEIFRLTNNGSDLTMSTELKRGGVDGEYVITHSSSEEFRSVASYKINGRDITITSSNVANSQFTSTNHKLQNGTRVTYTESGGTISELTSGDEYYVIVTGPDTFQLATTYQSAQNEQAIVLTAPASGAFTFAVKNVTARQEADGTVTLVANERKVTGTDTVFTQYFKPGDLFVAKNSTTSPATFDEYTISVVTDDTELYLQESPATALTNTQYYIDTKVYVKPDGSSQHRPFDGGVEINAGSSPNSSIVRQTRKYFRYQSGKGIQCSLAINFNPSRLIDTITGVANSTLPAKTKEVIITNIQSFSYNAFGEDRSGTVIGDNKTITVLKGDTIRLVVSASGHPTYIQSTARTSGSGQTNVVTTGVSNNGTDDGIIIWDTTNITPGTYYYQCSNHHTMVGQIVVDAAPTATSLVTVTTAEPHGLIRGNTVKISGSSDTEYNGTFTVVDSDDFSFIYECVDGSVARSFTTGTPSGLINYNPGNYSNTAIRCGLFDYQNGFFFEYNGTDLYAVRRSSVQQISGRSSVTSGSNIVTGTNTAYSRQLSDGDMIVIRGSSYRITAVENDTSLHIQPAYKGINSTDAVVTKTIDTKVPQSNWNIDKADGTGPSGFDLDITKIQMAYLDYSWYGAGKIRFGFKDTHGHVKYMHEFIHNNQLDEAYMRSGNIPGRYEIENTGGEVGFIPALFHWGTSVMMDGGFDDDKAYLFTAASNDLTFTNGDSASISTVANSSLIYNYNYGQRRFYWYVKIPFSTTDAGSFSTGVELYTAGGELNGEKVDYTDYAGGNFNVYIYVSDTRRYTPPAIYPSVSSGTAVSIGAPASGSTDTVDLTQDIPLISIRLAPSVDNNLTGALGARDIINRMQLQLKQLGITVTHDCNVDLILNGSISTRSFDKVQAPSLSELVTHESGDRIFGGTKVFSLRASGGQGNVTSITEDFDLSQITDLGNSILGGDGVFPNGPDMLTIAIVPKDTSLINATTPLKVSSRITWTESQA